MLWKELSSNLFLFCACQVLQDPGAVFLITEGDIMEGTPALDGLEI